MSARRPKQTYDLRHLRERANADGTWRYYWIKPGHKALRLPDDREAAHKACDTINRERADALEGKLSAGRAPKPTPETVADLIDRLQSGAEWRSLSVKTQVNYTHYFKLIAQVFGDQPLRAVTRPRAKEFLEAFSATPAARHQAYAAFRKLMYAALDDELIDKNPLAKLKIAKPDPRVVVWNREEDAAFVALADAQGLYYLGDAAVIATETGQRRGDILALTFDQWDPARGVLHFGSTDKTGAIVTVRATPRLAARMAAILDRRATGSDPARVILRPGQTRPLNEDAFSHEFLDLRRVLARTMSSVLHKHFRDFRDTAVVRLAEAGCTIPEICAITGHTLAEAHNILKHYFAPNQAMADSAIAKLAKHQEEA